MRIVYIHGANASSISFNYIRSKIKQSDILIEYDCHCSFDDNYNDMLARLSKTRSQLFFVAHSLGGVYALHLAAALGKRVAGAVTLSTPYGGSQEAEKARMFVPGNQLLRDIGNNSKPIRRLGDLPIHANWINIVTTAGASPFIHGDNDGVVSVASQTALERHMQFVRVAVNHYEVVLSLDTVKLIKQKLKKFLN